MTKAEREGERDATVYPTRRAGKQNGCACGGSNGRPVKIMIAEPISSLHQLRRADHRDGHANANAATAAAIDVKIIATLYRKHAPLLLSSPHFYPCRGATIASRDEKHKSSHDAGLSIFWKSAAKSKKKRSVWDG